MESIVFFGKGGIGKSTIASNMTAIMASGGGKVLHVGCDPKLDCTLSLMGGHIKPYTVMGGNQTGADLRGSIYPAAVKGAYCIEAGGPQPGVGCAGTAIGSLLDAMKDASLLEKDGYDTAVFDVLGDVVCGGFAAPLRRGFAKKVVIVTSEEILSLYAANRLIMMVDNYARNGVYLAGLAVNVNDPAGALVVKKFARAVNTRVLGVVLRDPAVAAAERSRRPAAIAYPKSGFTRRVRALSLAIRSAGAPITPPTAMTDADFFLFAQGRPAAGAKGGGGGRTAAAERPSASSAAALFAAAGFIPSGMEGSQIICDWRAGHGRYKIVITQAAAAREGMSRFSDWAVCFHPTSAAARPGDDLPGAAGRLASLRFDELLSVFSGMKDFYGGFRDLTGPEDKTLSAPDTPRRPHMGFGQWQRFIFPDGLLPAFIPPGSVMIEHGDSECRFSQCDGGALKMFCGNHDAGASGLHPNIPQLPKHAPRIVNTDFNACDAVFGDEDKMLGALSGAAEMAGPRGLVEFYTGCSPIMLAGDVSAVAGRVEKEKGVKIVLERYNSFYGHDQAKAAVRVSFMADRLSRAARERTHDVNLINFGGADDGLSALLGELGISARVPGNDFYAAAASAELQVLSGPDTVLGPAFDKAGLKWILPPAPYGFAGTSAWVKAIAGALRVKQPGAAPSDGQKKQALELWRRAGRFTAAFVLAPEEIGLLSESTALIMAPVLPVLAEAGFKVRLFVMDGPAAAPSVLGPRITALKTAFPGLRLTTAAFSTPPELAQLLRSERALRLVYSDIRRDRRVVSAGKNPFSAGLFEPGYEGALETWRRLLYLCEWDFNERYLRQ